MFSAKVCAMCLILFAWRPGHAVPLLMAANRDEFYARPSLPLGHWDDLPGVYGGRDLQAGGTWLGLGPQGRFAALTNVRDPQQPLGTRSRGELPTGFLASAQAPGDFLNQLTMQAGAFSGFNLLLGNSRELWHYNSASGAPQQLCAGIYGVSNADLNSPWPKLLRARHRLEQALLADDESLFALLADAHRPADAELPETGVGLEIERLLSSVFIASPSYGTRASTLLKVHADGTRQIRERCFGPEGVLLGETCLRLRLDQTVQA